jgi:hypothetical protein
MIMMLNGRGKGPLPDNDGGEELYCKTVVSGVQRKKALEAGTVE